MECNQSSFLLADSKGSFLWHSEHASSESDSDPDDFITLKTLTEDDLTRVANNPRCKALLTEVKSSP